MRRPTGLALAVLAAIAWIVIAWPVGWRSPDSGSTSPHGLALARRNLADSEYEATPSRRGFQAPNRAHELRTFFESTGIRIERRSGRARGDSVRLALAGVGRGATLHHAEPGHVTSRGARVEIHRRGVIEWYENSRAGLEQGFTLTSRPHGRGDLILDLWVTGARAELDEGSRALLKSPGGRHLAYSGLVVSDAEGRRLAARLEVPSPSQLRVRVDDRDARYPLVIDPLITGETRVESDQDGAQLGFRVASAGDVNGDGYDDVIVGAPFFDHGEMNEGAAFVFLGGVLGVASGGPGSATATLQVDQVGAELGSSVAGAGDVDGDGHADVIVGAPLYDSGSEGVLSDAGAAFVWLGDASGISAGAPARLESDQEFALFGLSVAGAGNVDGDAYDDVIVGAPFYDAGETDEGAAFVFGGSASGVPAGDVSGAQARLESDQGFADFGFSVAGAGDVNGDGYDDVIVGADEYSAGESGEGAAFVFHGSGPGITSAGAGEADARLESDQADADFGISVGSAGDVDHDGYGDVVVGAPLYDGLASDAGAAFVFTGAATGIGDADPDAAWARLESDQAGADFGWSVAGVENLDGDVFSDLVVGARLFDADETDEGAAFVYASGGARLVPSLGTVGLALTAVLLAVMGLRRVGRGDAGSR